jgi:hypothetical protein
MIGAESQSQALGCYAGDESPSCNKYEVMAGTSYNFLTSSAICWRETFNAIQQEKFKKAQRRFDKWLPPNNGVRHKMAFQPVNLPLLDGFDIYGPLPKTCYFDHKNKVKF